MQAVSRINLKSGANAVNETKYRLNLDQIHVHLGESKTLDGLDRCLETLIRPGPIAYIKMDSDQALTFLESEIR